MALFLVSVWRHEGFGGISNRFVLLLLHAVVLSEAMMMCSTVSVWDSTVAFLVAHLNHKIRHWDESCFRMACLAETCCFIIAWGSRSKCILALLKWGNLFPYFSIQFILIFMTFYEVIFSSNRCMVSVHQTVRTVLNRSHLSPACCCSLLWPQYEPHMTAEADHKVQEYCYLPKLSDPKLCIQARFLFHSEENKEIIER